MRGRISAAVTPIMEGTLLLPDGSGPSQYAGTSAACGSGPMRVEQHRTGSGSYLYPSLRYPSSRPEAGGPAEGRLLSMLRVSR